MTTGLVRWVGRRQRGNEAARCGGGGDSRQWQWVGARRRWRTDSSVAEEDTSNERQLFGGDGGLQRALAALLDLRDGFLVLEGTARALKEPRAAEAGPKKTEASDHQRRQKERPVFVRRGAQAARRPRARGWRLCRPARPQDAVPARGTEAPRRCPLVGVERFAWVGSDAVPARGTAVSRQTTPAGLGSSASSSRAGTRGRAVPEWLQGVGGSESFRCRCSFWRAGGAQAAAGHAVLQWATANGCACDEHVPYSGTQWPFQGVAVSQGEEQPVGPKHTQCSGKRKPPRDAEAGKVEWRPVGPGCVHCSGERWSPRGPEVTEGVGRRRDSITAALRQKSEHSSRRPAQIRKQAEDAQGGSCHPRGGAQCCR